MIPTKFCWVRRSIISRSVAMDRICKGCNGWKLNCSLYFSNQLGQWTKALSDVHKEYESQNGFPFAFLKHNDIAGVSQCVSSLSETSMHPHVIRCTSAWAYFCNDNAMNQTFVLWFFLLYTQYALILTKNFILFGIVTSVHHLDYALTKDLDTPGSPVNKKN